jgi:hypothetical protein
VTWYDLQDGDVIEGADGLPWLVVRSPRGRQLCQLDPCTVEGEPREGASYFGRPDQDAAVSVVRRGETGEVVDLLQRELGAEFIREEAR